ncbi:MAG: hypothetical protein APR62_01650 [Smithella sp. SDB]|nr:MAG: hypothetical protein APR62_01650 [Smithella sp. SDB]
MRAKFFISVAVLITFLSGAFLVPNSFADSKERDEIIKFIKQKKARWSARDTKISRFTNTERKKRLGSQIPIQTIQEKILVTTSAAVPSQLDWRNYNGSSYVTPIKEQGDCSDCWAFASTAALESNKLISGNTPGVFLDLSEQTLNSCSGAGNCSGGYIDAAANFLRDIGVPLEACNPYTATDGMCSVSCSDWLTNPYKISGWYKVNPAVEAIKYALYNYGPVVALMAVNTDYYYYSTGVYEYSWGSFEGYHAVLVVGYDDVEQCFIIKSSWGEDWGEAGYGKIAYSEVAGDTQLGFWTIAYENAIPTDFPIQDSIPRDPDNPNTGNQNGNSNTQLSILNGSVKDESGNAVSGAEIKINKYKVASNTAGIYVFSSLPAGTYVATVSKSGYSTLSENLTVAPSATVTKDFVISSSQNVDKQNDKKDNILDFYGPGWIHTKPRAVTPQAADLFFKSRKEKIIAAGSTKAPLAGAAADISTDIQELARALRYDPKLIYDYIHNNIEYVSYYGSLKGAELTYLDGSGNDFDQASLMIALLRASGYTAQYVHGQMTIPVTNLANWLGVDPTSQAAVNSALLSAYIPHTYVSNSFQLNRVWVQATISGTNYLFDPAFKTYDNKSIMPNMGTAMGYNQSDLLSAARSGATVTADYIMNLNETLLRNKLTTYTTNLANYLKSNYPNSEVRDIVGGRSIVKETLTAYSTTLPFSPVITSGWPKNDISSELKTIMSVAICRSGLDSYGNCPLSTSSEIYQSNDTADLSGRRMTLSFNNSGKKPEIRLDGSLTATGNTSDSSSTIYMTIKIDHPYADNTHDQIVTYSLKSSNSTQNFTYAIVYNFGSGMPDRLLLKRQKQLELYRSQGLSDTSESVLGESLNIIGQNWLKQVVMSNKILAGIAQRVFIEHHNVGVVAQEGGYYIDVKAGMYDTSTIHGGIGSDWFAIAEASSLILSGLEHSILEQLMGSTTPAASTIKVLQLANAAGIKVYRLTHSNYSSYINSFTNYSSADITSFSNTLSNDTGGYISFIIPSDGKVGLPGYTWKGDGYIYTYLDSVNYGGEIRMVIGGGYFGGYLLAPGLLPIQNTFEMSAEVTSQVLTPESIFSVASIVDCLRSIEPVDMAGGAYTYEHTDLALGGSLPLGLAFSRSYNSNDNLTKQTLGYGFDHNYNIYHRLASHAEPVLGSRQPLDAAGMLVTLYTCLDLTKLTPNIENRMVAVLAAKWGIDQLINNSIAINMGSKVTEYIKLADGTYVAPPGITTKLIQNSGGTFSLQERFGTKINFNAAELNANNISIGRVSQIVDTDGNTATFTYNTDKTLQKVTDAFGRTLTFTYTSGNITSIADSASPVRTVSYSYDANNNLTGYTDAESKLWSYGYNSDHRMTTLTNPQSITTATNVYDTLGRVKTQTVPRQGGGTVTYNFYFSGYRNQEEDPAGKTITYYYDEKGRAYATEDALGNRTTKTYDGQNHVIKVVDPLLNETNYEYDGENNLIQVTDALNQTVENFYDTQFRLVETKDALSHSTLYNYDAEHHLLDVTDAVGNKAENTYYANGFKNTVKDPRLTVTTLTYDTYGNPLTSQTAAHPAITYNYDAIGRMSSLTDQVGSTTSFFYDKRNLLQSKTDPLGKTTSYAYDNAGRLISKTDRKNQTITYTYTPSDKMDTITYPDASTVGFTYNTLDRMTAMQDAIGTAAYVYDDAGRLTSMTDSNGFTISYAYDANGNLTSLTYPGNKKVIYIYDALNRLQTVTIAWLNQTATYADYDPAGRLPGFTNFNGTTTTYNYDNASRLTSISNQAGANVISSYTFTLDGNGNRTDITQNEPYSPAIGDEGNVTYGYNDKKNRLTTAGSTTFTYDDEGQIAADSGNNYAFDYEHRLKAITGTNAAQFYYDGSGNRLKAVRSSGETRYIYDAAGRLLAEANASNVITRYYIYGSGLLAMVTPAGQTYCYHFNGVGSTIAMTDSSQNIVNQYSYDAFGNIPNPNQQENILNNDSRLLNQPFKYVGQAGVMTEPNGFYYMKARYYDPAVGRFISEDPSGFGGGDVNLSSYTGNNPITRVDPFGDAWLEIRPLDFLGFRDTTAGPFYHSNFIYDDGKNSGYNPDRKTGLAVVGPDQAKEDMTAKYQTVGVYLQDDILRQAESNLKSAWNQTTNPNAPDYSLLFHNCHDYTGAVLKEYDTLLVSSQLSSKLGGIFSGSMK